MTCSPDGHYDDALLGISYVTGSFELSVPILLNHPVMQRITSFLSLSSGQRVFVAACKIIGNISASEESYARPLIELGILTKFKAFLLHGDECLDALKEILWILSNIITEGNDILDHYISIDMIPLILTFSNNPSVVVRKEVICCVINAFEIASMGQIEYLKSVGSLEAIQAIVTDKYGVRFGLLDMKVHELLDKHNI